jgi:hypothetical protein
MQPPNTPPRQPDPDDNLDRALADLVDDSLVISGIDPDTGERHSAPITRREVAASMIPPLADADE